MTILGDINIFLSEDLARDFLQQNLDLVPEVDPYFTPNYRAQYEDAMNEQERRDQRRPYDDMNRDEQTRDHRRPYDDTRRDETR